MHRFSDIQIVTPQPILDQDLLVDDQDVIIATLDREDGPPTQWLPTVAVLAFPGMLDLLTNGYGHHFYGDAELDAVTKNSSILPRHGVTGFVPSFLSQADGPKM